MPSTSDAVSPGTKATHFRYYSDASGVTITRRSDDSKASFPLSGLPPAIVAQLAAHGLTNKLSNDVATLTTTDEKVAGQQEVYAKLANGIWSERAARDPSGLSKPHVEFAEAVSRAYGHDLELVKGKLLAMAPDDYDERGNPVKGERSRYIAEHRARPKIIAALEELALAKQKAKVSTAKAAAKADQDVFEL